MRGKWKVAAACGISVVLVAAMAPAAAAAGGKGSTLEVLLDEGLSSPKGLAVTQDRDLAIGQGAFGAPGPALVYDLRGKGAGSIYPVTDPTMPLNLIDVAVSPKDGTGWGIQAGENGGTLIHQLADGTIVDVLDIPAYQATDPDPVDHRQSAVPDGIECLRPDRRPQGQRAGRRRSQRTTSSGWPRTAMPRPWPGSTFEK